MRTSLILLASVVLLAACSNDAETTAPLSSAASTTDAAAANALQPGQNSKPQYFSTVTTVQTPIAAIDGVNMIALGVNAMCPAGSVVTGGGYQVSGQNAKVLYSGPLGTNAWRVYVWSNTGANFAAYAVCAQ